MIVIMAKSPMAFKKQVESQREKAERFRALHRRGRILILPNAWDVPSARVFEDAGFPAVATSSAGMMVSLGYPDGESIPRELFLSAVQRIASSLSVPLSVDIVSGFGERPQEIESMITNVVEAGGIGLNIEDYDLSSDKLRPVEKAVEKIKLIKKLCEKLDVPIVINGRTDALSHGSGSDEEKLKEAISRAKAYRDAGSDCVYPMRLADARSIEIFVKELDFPTNVMIRKGLPSIQELERLGVARVSFGPSASYATMGLLKRASQEVIESGTYENLTEGAITFDELNRLASPQNTNQT
jgi:2-methylisocitrate lyase-like PEP mutase family enzyme